MASSPVASAAEIRLPAWLAAMALPAAPASDSACMAFAVAAAGENVARRTGGPFGAVLRDDASGEILGVGVNLAMTSGNPVLHAETVAISLAGQRLEAAHSLTLFTSCEPCIMCLGACHWAKVRRIVSAASRLDAEAVGFSEGAGIPQLRTEMAARGVVFDDGMLREAGMTALRTYAEQGGVIYGPR